MQPKAKSPLTDFDLSEFAWPPDLRVGAKRAGKPLTDARGAEITQRLYADRHGNVSYGPITPAKADIDPDLLCPNCSTGELVMVHSHMKCRFCGWRNGCCDGG